VAFATGKYAYGICDYCGQQYKLHDLRKNWKGFMVCPSDYEPKEPQLFPLNYRADAIALEDPRPARREPLVVYVGLSAPAAYQSVGMQPAPAPKPVQGVGQIGTVTVAIS
jgi:hypothetical protein